MIFCISLGKSCILIPGTPQEEDKTDRASAKGKRMFGRSFLTSAASVTDRPGKHAAKEEIRKMSQARKGLLSVSVKFSHCPNTSTEQDKGLASVEGETEKEGGVGDSFLEKKNHSKKNGGIGGNKVESKEDIKDEKSAGTIELDVCSKVVDDGEDCKGKQKSLEEKENYSEEMETPTKVYGGKNLKRMSKTGLSPNSKRNQSENMCMENGASEKNNDSSDSSEFELKFESENNADCDKHLDDADSVKHSDDVARVRRSLSEFEKKIKKSKIKPNSSAVNNYQLTMNRPKCKKEIMSTEDDTLLGELLGEIESPCAVKSDINPQNVTKIKARKSLTKTSAKSVINKEASKGLTEDEMKFFDSLDMEIHTDFTHSVNDMAEMHNIKTASSDKLQLSTKPVILKKSFKSKCKGNDTSTISDKGREDLRGNCIKTDSESHRSLGPTENMVMGESTGQNLDMSMKEDIKCDVSKNIQSPFDEMSKISSNVQENVKHNADVPTRTDTRECDIEEMVTQNRPASSTSQMKPTQVIKEYSTPEMAKGDHPGCEDIDEFQSQLDAELMADSFTMSPVKGEK